MLLFSIFLLIFSNSLSNKLNISIYYSRLGIITQYFCMYICYNNMYILYLEQGLGLYSGLFNISSISYILDILIFILTMLILNLTGFYPKQI